MAGAIHQIAVRRVLDDHPAARIKGMRASLRRAIPEIRDDLADLPVVVPDIYMIDEVHETLVVYEVEAGNPVDDAKMRVYAELWWMLDEHSWRFALVTVDRWGGYTKQIDMSDFAIRHVIQEAKRKDELDPSWETWIAAFRADADAP
jgi:hypothetical protein